MRLKQFKKELPFHLMIWPGMMFFIIFSYLPMFGIIMAFQDFAPRLGFLGSPWVGLMHFENMFSDPFFIRAIRNTVAMSVIKYIPSFIMPIVFALMLNELKNINFKRVIQTVSYLPHFISWVIVASLLQFWLRTDSFGLINIVLVRLGFLQEPIAFLASTRYFWAIAAISEVWKSTGWWSIIYLAAISGVDPGLYEAATIDGAGRFRRMRHITLPAIKSTVITILILSVGQLITGGIGGSNFQQSFLLMNPLNMPVSDIIETYILRFGLTMGRFSYAAAAGLLQSVVSFSFVVGVNALVRYLDREEALF